MDFDFPEDMKALREEARRFLADKCPVSSPRRILEGDDAYDRDLWQEMGRLGWIGATVAESHGGGGLGHLAVCVLAEELGAALAPVPYASSVYFAIEAIAQFGSDVLQAEHLPRLASGERIGTIALAELPGALVINNLRARLVDGRLSGTKLAVA